MSSAQWMLVVTAVLAVVAIAAAVVAVRAARRVAAAAPLTTLEVSPADSVDAPVSGSGLAERQDDLAPVVRPEPYVVDGRLFVPPTQQQVVAAALGRPHVRLAVAVHGLTHALRPESRDRILAVMRREYRRRRRLRLRAARRAVREASPGCPSAAADSWIGELPAGRAVDE